MIYSKIKCAVYVLAVLLLGNTYLSAQNTDLQLILNTPIEKEISSNEKHTYQINAKKDEFVRVVINQINSDVSLKISKSNGQRIYEINNSRTREEIERVSFIAEDFDVFQIEVGFIKKIAGNLEGKDYQIKLDTLSSVSEKNRTQIKAERLYDKANSLRIKRDAEARKSAIKIFQESAQLFSQVEDKIGEAFAYYAIGQVNGLLSNYDEALANHKKAIEIFKQQNSPRQYVKVLAESSTVYFYKDELEEAIQATNEALEIYKNLGDKRGEAEMIGNLGTIFGKKSEPRKALKYYLQALPILEAENDKAQVGRMFSTIGSVYDDLGEPFTSLEYYEKALKVRRDLGDEYAESFTLANMSIVLKGLGEYERAIEASSRAFDIFSKIGMKYGVAATLNILGTVNDDLGDAQTARDYYERSLKLSRETKNFGSEGTLLNNIAVLEIQDGNSEKALELLNDALIIFKKIKAKRQEGHILVKLGEVWQVKGDTKKALEYFNLALPILREIEDKNWESTVLFRLGEVERQNKNLTLAKSYSEKGLRLNRQAGDIAREWLLLLGLAKIEKDLGNLAEAQKHIEYGIKVLEDTRTNLKQRKFKRTYLSSKQDSYTFYIDLLVERHRKEPKAGFDAMAFEASENARAKSLLESLGESRFNIRSGIDAKLLEKEKVLRQTINAKDSQRLIHIQNKQTTKANQFEKELRELLNQYGVIQTQIREQSPQFANLTQPKTTSLKETQSNLLDENTVLLEYVLGKEKSYLFFVTRSSVEIVELPSNEKIEKTARQFIKNVRALEEFIANETPQQRESRLKSAELEWKKQGKILSGVLFYEIGDKLKNKRLLIVTPGVLQYVPFATLEIPFKSNNPNDKFLIQTNEIVSLPSVSVLSALRKNEKKQLSKDQNSIAILADPVFSQNDIRLKQSVAKSNNNQNVKTQKVKAERVTRQLNADFSRLRFSRREAQAIESFIPSNQRFVALDFLANTDIVSNKKFQQANILHFATHGITNSEFPELSSIVLSMVDKNGEQQNGYLRLQDIYNLKINADLVVLSACDTGLGKEIRGEGVIGLTRGFMYAGSESVITSLWKVEDRATAELMKKFYRAMLKDGQKPVAALRTAQIEMLKDKRWESPFYWAAFTLQGEWQ